jgi:glycosyltransferase involved in cell wall biosynthesis
VRIAHFLLGRCNPESANGIDKTVYFLSSHQASLGHTVALFSITDKPALPIDGVEVRTYASRRLPQLGMNLRQRDLLVNRSPFNLPGLLVEELVAWDPDIVHLHFVQVPQNIVLARHIRRKGIAYCVTTHGGLALGAQQRHRLPKRIFALLAERSYLERASFVHGVSVADVEGLRAYGVSNAVVVAPNGLDVATVPPECDAGLVRRLFPQSAQRRVFLFLGRLDVEQKGLDLLLTAWSKAGVGDRAFLILVGPDWRHGRRQLEEMTQRLDIGESVVFAGAVFGQTKWDLLAGTDTFVHPSRWEAGLPFSVCEAMAARRPVVVTPSADPDGLVERYGAGMISTPDAHGLAEAIRRLADAETQDLVAMGGQARSLVMQELNWQTIAQRIVDGYTRFTAEAKI